MLCFTLKNLKILPISSKNLILEFHRQGNLWLSRRGKETKWNAKKETVNGVVKLISQMVYVRINNFAQWGLKIVDYFSWHKYCSKYISRALGVSCESLFPHGRPSSKSQHHGWVSCAPYTYFWTICIIWFFLQCNARWIPETTACQELYILQTCRILPSVTHWPTSLTETPTRGFNRALCHSADCCRFYEN